MSKHFKLLGQLADSTLTSGEDDLVTAWGALEADDGTVLSSAVDSGDFADTPNAFRNVAGDPGLSERFLIGSDDAIPGLRFQGTVGVESATAASSVSIGLLIKMGRVSLRIEAGTAEGESVFAACWLESAPQDVQSFSLPLAAGAPIQITLEYAPKPSHGEGFADITLSTETDSETLRFPNKETPALFPRQDDELQLTFETVGETLAGGEFVMWDLSLDSIKVSQD